MIPESSGNALFQPLVQRGNGRTARLDLQGKATSAFGVHYCNIRYANVVFERVINLRSWARWAFRCDVPGIHTKAPRFTHHTPLFWRAMLRIVRSQPARGLLPWICALATISSASAGSYYASGNPGVASDIEAFGAGVLAASSAASKLTYAPANGSPSTVMIFPSTSGSPWGVAVALELGGVFLSLNADGVNANASTIVFLPLTTSAPTTPGTVVVATTCSTSSVLRDIDYSLATKRLYWAGSLFPLGACHVARVYIACFRRAFHAQYLIFILNQSSIISFMHVQSSYCCALGFCCWLAWRAL